MKSLAVALGILGLSACGGGGDGGPGPAPALTAALTSANQTVVAQDTLTSAQLPLFGAELLTGVRIIDERVLFRFAREQLSKLPGYLASATSTPQLVGVIQSATVPCSSGSLSVSATDADNNNVISGGDSISITSNNCVDTFGTLGGSMGFTVHTVTGDFGSDTYSSSLTMTFNGLTISDNQFSAGVNGSLNVSISASGVNHLSTTVSTPSLSVSGTYAGQATRSITLANYTGTSARTPDLTYGYLTSYSITGNLTSSAISSQSVAFATVTPFVNYPADNYPARGVLVITGAGNSKLKLTALSSTQVLQELDANGDGIYEGNAAVSWSSLM